MRGDEYVTTGETHQLEWLDKDPFINYKLRFHKTERSYLTERELRLIEETDFTGAGYEKVKDTFLFSCYTGLSYIDVRELEKNQLVLGIDGNQWIYTKREKTYYQNPMLYKK